MKKVQATKKLLEIVTEHFESENEAFESAVNLATDFSIENSISSDSLRKLTYFCASNKFYSLAYMLMKEEQAIEELLKIVTEHFESENKDFESAVSLATDFSIENSISSDSLFKLAYFCGSNKFYSLAYIFAKTCAILSAENVKKATAHFTAGFASFIIGRRKEAEEQYKLALEANPNDADIHYNYGYLLAELGCKKEAKEQYKLALEADSKHVNAHLNYGNLLCISGRREEAEEQYRFALEDDPKHVNAHSNYGTLLFEMGREEEAEEQYKLALEADLNDADTHYNYGINLEKMGREEEAEEQYKLALKADPKHINTYSNYGNLLLKMGRAEEAEKQYKLALKVAPNDACTHSNYGDFQKEMGKIGEAKEHYQLALEIDPNNVHAHSNYGLLLCKMERNEEAEKHYQLALETDPNNADVHSNYGNILCEMGCKEEAEEQYKLALDLNPKHVDAHSNYGNILCKMGRNEEAKKQYKLALEFNPNNADVNSNYGSLLYKMRRNEEAEKRYQLALKTDPKHVGAHTNYGNLLHEMGHNEEAEEQYKLAIALDPKSPQSHAAYGILLLSMNLEEEAIEKTNTASSLFNEKGDITREHIVFAWLYEALADRYYFFKKYQESGKYAEMSGNEYIEAGKHAGERFKGTSLTKGYTLKGRAKIRKLDLLDLQPPYTGEMFAKIMNCIYDASKCYNKAAEASPINNLTCNACSLSLRCLSEMLDYMLAVTKQEEVHRLKDKIKTWEGYLASCEKIYKGSGKGERFIRSLYKLMACIETLEQFKQFAMWTEGKAFEDCFFELKKTASTIEGPLQKIIENSAEQMDHCRREVILYEGIRTKPFKGLIDKNEESGSKHTVKPNIDLMCAPESQSRNQAVILTAIPEEYNAIRSHLTDLKEDEYKGTIYEIGQFIAVNNKLWNIAIVELGMHNSRAAFETERASEYFKPDVILFVGVAGGIKDVTIGDIVAVTKAYGYEYGKESKSFSTRPEAPESTYDLIQRARMVARNKKWIDRIHSNNNQSPKAFVGPVASGERVIASTQSATYKFIRSSYNDALAVDMESVGFLQATHADRKLMSIVIRGISDVLDRKSESDREGSQALASRNAAAFAFELISQHNFNKK